MLGRNNHLSYRTILEEDIPNDDPYVKLGWGIVGQAIRDLYEAWLGVYRYQKTKYICDKKGEKVSKTTYTEYKGQLKEIKDCQDFFRSDYFRLLSQNKISGEKIEKMFDILKEEAKSTEPFNKYCNKLFGGLSV